MIVRMPEISLVEVESRLHVVELGLQELRARVAGGVPSTANWLDVVSGSMSDIPEETYREIMAAGRAIVAGEADLREDL